MAPDFFGNGLDNIKDFMTDLPLLALVATNLVTFLSSWALWLGNECKLPAT